MKSFVINESLRSIDIEF